MSIVEIILIGVALAMDAFALTISNCTTYKDSLTVKKEWAMPVAFALFQFAMPIIGFYVGSIFKEGLEKVAGYMTAGIFFFLALKIVFDNVKEINRRKKGEEETVKANFNVGILLLQGVATSIDALLIGITFSVQLTFSVFIACTIVGVITFLIVMIALFIGKSLGKILGKYAQWAGAIVLFALAIKNLLSAIL